jgi:hypothetical protein
MTDHAVNKIRAELVSYLPHDQPATFCAKDQNIAILGTSNSNAADALWERNKGLLVSLLSTINVNDGLVSLCGENVRRAHGQAIGMS